MVSGEVFMAWACFRKGLVGQSSAETSVNGSVSLSLLSSPLSPGTNSAILQKHHANYIVIKYIHYIRRNKKNTCHT